jgi:hypothetical protein
MRKYEHLNAAFKPLVEGIDPPAGKINPDYVQQPSNPRICETCGKWHDFIIENTMTGERIEELKNCKECIMQGYEFE